MARIQIKLVEIGEGYVQFQSVAAFLILKDREYLLDSALLDAQDYEEDLEILESFCGNMEAMADENDMKIEFDEEITQLEIELNLEIERIEEEKESIYCRT